MAQISSSVGLVSGLNTSAIITALLSLDQQPITLLQNRVASSTAQNQAYQALGTQLQTLQQIGQSLELPTTFANSTATSSDPSVLTATAGAAAAAGSYQFNVASLVSSQQAISSGYASANSLVGAGTISISQGGGEASSQTTLAQLNGGTGIAAGQFRITDGSGNSSVINTANDVTLNDVVNQINSSQNISVRALVKNDHLVLQDDSGQNKTNFSVVDLGNGQAAANLGIVGSTGGGTITGANINTINISTPLSLLNDGRGIGTANGAADFQVALSDGTKIVVSLGAAQNVGDVLAAINKAGGSKLSAAIDKTTNSITLSDNSGGGGTFSVSALNNSSAAQDLGLSQSTSGATLSGNTLLASLNSVLISSLNGGSGLALGTIHITDRTGGAGKDIDLSKATSFSNIIDDINNAGLSVTASLNHAGDGIQLQDASGAGGSLVVSDVNSTTAHDLGISGTFDPTQSTVQGANLHTQYVSASTLLSKFNGGAGVGLGSFSITNSKGVSSTVDLSQGTFTSIGDVIAAINAKGIGVNASINSTGDGLLLTDTAGGTTSLKVANVSGTTATDLNIAGAASTGTTTLDGSFTKTIAVSAADTLATLQKKIQTLGFGVSASIVNDGSGNNGYHLSLTALNSGRSGRFVFDGGTTSLVTQNVVNAQDAAVFYGGSNAANPLLVTSSTNQVANVIPGVTLTLQGTGQTTLNVAADPTVVSGKLQSFTDTFNGLVNEISTLTQWNSTTNTAGLLLGDSTVSEIQAQLYNVVNSVVSGAGQYKTLAQVGITIGSGATLSYDATKFDSAYATNPAAVQNLFTQATTGLGSVIDKTLNHLIDPVSGEVTIQENTLNTQITGFQTQITQLNAILANQKSALENEFANMEVVLSQLQSQGAALSSIGTISSSTTSSSNSNSSNSSANKSTSAG